MQTRRVWWFVGMLAAGCGSSPGGGAGRPVDAGDGPDASPVTDAGPVIPPDAAPPAARCDPKKPFAAPVAVANVSSANRDQGTIVVDELTIWFGSDRASPTMIYEAKRDTPAGAFHTPVALKNINGTLPVLSPTLTGDGLTLYYTQQAGAAQGDIMVSHRASRDVDFPAGTAVIGVNSTVDDEDPYITPDGSALYFGSSRGSANNAQLDMYVAFRQANGTFATPQVIPGNNLNTPFPDSHPHLTPDGLTLYWSSNRTDGGAQGGTDIWLATRTSTAGEFANPTRVPELSSAMNESLSWISDDGCEAYLQSDRPGGLGAQDIYVAHRPL
ncbi:MAG TPA: hypothetical protein VFP84_04235 [Kofleriaceae bacterium]|nr:hypothetical protein [Kofleriaceae bacterium]